ncbi:MAG: hypothetical protein IIB73_09380 [Proteobacteria bacterium]|nr:hypothetical protein [Pseudomonadota bacterium]
MKKPGSHVSSEKAGRMLKADAPNTRGSGRRGGRLDSEVERWFATAGAAFPSSRSSIIPMLQAALGYLPRDAMQAIARHLVVPPVDFLEQIEAQKNFSLTMEGTCNDIQIAIQSESVGYRRHRNLLKEGIAE